MMKRFKYELNSETTLRSELAFDDENQKLYQLLREKSAQITKNEMRLCALFKSGNTLTEIAKRIGRSPNSINVAFARIRSKLGLGNNKELKMLMSEYQPESDIENQIIMRVNP
jgi:DNA-binding CsgD family transcriptional regulator